MKTLTRVQIKESGIDTSLPGTVILYNDDYHTFEDVIHQLIRAVNCSKQKAEQHAFEVHNTGKSKVYHGELEECLNVSSVLEEIHLTTGIEI